MIKNYKQYNESLRDLMIGPTEDEVMNSLGDLSPDELLKKSSKIGFIKGVETALYKGANVHYRGDYSLRVASDEGHTDIVKLLLDKGADVHAYNDQSLISASEKGHTDVVKLLLDRDANIHADDDKSLRGACYYDYVDVVQLLLNRGANIHADDDFALRLIEQDIDCETVDLLKKYLNKPTNESLRDLMVGPTKEEVWKSLGYNKPFETPKEYLNYITERIEKKDIGYKFRWIYKGSDIYQYFVDSRILYVNERLINILETMFNLDFVDVLNLIKREVIPKLNLPEIPKDIQSNRLL